MKFTNGFSRLSVKNVQNSIILREEVGKQLLEETRSITPEVQGGSPRSEICTLNDKNVWFSSPGWTGIFNDLMINGWR
jgi:hypothetical protein